MLTRSPNWLPGVLVAEDWQSGGFGIYVHWPFCQSKCPYCDFNSHVRSTVDHKRWERSLVQEIKTAAQSLPGRTVSSVFFGGGTPSLMEPSTVEAVLKEIRGHWPVSNTLEVTLEANPTSVEAGKFAEFQSAGVNRISMGIQSLKDSDLKRLGRLHTAQEARNAFDIARAIFDRVSFDLIYARQDQSIGNWADELSEAAAMAVDHLSLYQLTIENGTRFGELYDKGRLLGLPPDDTSAKMYEVTQDICAKHGLLGYETSNHAAPGAECQHNLVYWRYGDYVGIGPGAHGRISFGHMRLATVSSTNPEEWLKTVENHGTAVRISETLSTEDQASEYLMMSLRLAEGSDPSRYSALARKELPPDRLYELAQQDLVSLDEGRIRTTGRGRMLLNSILRELLV